MSMQHCSPQKLLAKYRLFVHRGRTSPGQFHSTSKRRPVRPWVEKGRAEMRICPPDRQERLSNLCCVAQHSKSSGLAHALKVIRHSKESVSPYDAGVETPCFLSFVALPLLAISSCSTATPESYLFFECARETRY